MIPSLLAEAPAGAFRMVNLAHPEFRHELEPRAWAFGSQPSHPADDRGPIHNKPAGQAKEKA